MSEPGRSHVDPIERPDVQLWLFVLVVMALDVGLTVYGLERGLLERNPVVLLGLETFGYAALAFLKVPALLLGLVGWVVLSERMRRLNLVGLALPWAVAVVVNVSLIVRVL